MSDSEELRTIREICDREAIGERGKFLQARRDSILEQLHISFWRGRFETRGRSRLKIDLSGGDRHQECTRALLYLVFPKTGPRVPNLDGCRSEAERYLMIAGMKIGDFERNEWWFSNFFENVLIPLSELSSWNTMRSQDDDIGRRIDKVLQAAAKKAEANSSLSNSDLARLLTRGGPRFEGFGTDAVRRILGGTYRPAQDRKRPGLRDWMGKTP